MDNADRWYFTKDQLANTPSRKCGISEARELSFRQQAANFIQDMGQRLQVNQLCINTAIVYMHRFYVFHSFTEIHRNKLSLSALFLAAKVEEQPRKLEHLIKVAHACLHKDLPPIDVRSEAYQEKMFEVVAHENILLQTLGFVLAIEHPHTYVVKVCQLVKASKELAQTSYIMATTSLHMTTMCLMYKPTVVACVCIHLACKWSDWRIEKCSEGRDWFFYVDKSVTVEKLEALTDKFIAIMETSPHRFKKKFGQKDANMHGPRSLMDEPSTSKAAASSDGKQEPTSPAMSSLSYDFADFDMKPMFRDRSPTKAHSTAVPAVTKPSTPNAPPPVAAVPASSNSHHKKPIKTESSAAASHSISLDVYREKREKERLQAKVPPPAPPAGADPVPVKKPHHAYHDARRSSKYPPEPAPEFPPAHKDRSSSKVAENVKEEHSTSANKVNHQLAPKVNMAEGSHYKERPNTMPPVKQEKISLIHDKVDVILQNKISPIPQLDPPFLHDKVDYVKQEKSEYAYVPQQENDTGDYVYAPQDKKDSVKLEKPDHGKPDKIDIKQEKLDYSKYERVDEVRQKSDPSKHEKAEQTKHEKIDVKPENIKIKTEKVDPIKFERTDVKSENRNSFPVTITPNSIPRSSHKTDHTTSLEPVVKKERKEKHKKHSKDRERSSSNHIEHVPPAGIKVKIPKTVINLSGKVPESSQKYTSPPPKPESPKRSLKIKLPKPPEEARVVKPVASTSIKLVITKDKSGTGSYSTSHKNDREKESRKRMHSNSVPDGNGKTHHDGPHSKHQKLEHSQKSHHSNSKSGKSSRHGSHRMEHSVVNDCAVPQYPPANGNNVLNAQSYSQGYMYNFPPPPQPPKMKAMPTGKTNSNPPLPPPLPPPPPPPPE